MAAAGGAESLKTFTNKKRRDFLSSQEEKEGAKAFVQIPSNLFPFA